MTLEVCPLNHNAGESVCRYAPTITSDTRIVAYDVVNCICRECGLIYNATGTREHSDFYFDEYDLHSESAAAEFFYFDQSEAVGIHDNVLRFINDHVSLAADGAALDIGCGKGLLLRTLSRYRQNWQLRGIEPSRNAAAFFAEIMPDVDVFEGLFEDSPFVTETYDLVMAHGVLEHVPEPLPFLRQFRGCLKPDGIGFIGVPNFETNPFDLFTCDHLTRFTPLTLAAVLAQSGLEIVAELVLSARVPMWFLVRRAEPTAIGSSLHEVSRDVLDHAVDLVKRSFAAVDKCLEDAAAAERPVAQYGTGALGYLAHEYASLTPERLNAVYDDNETMWDSVYQGLTIRSPQHLAAHPEANVFISANPCYNEQISKRIHELTGGAARVYHG